MSTTNIESLIKNDLETFLHYKSLKGNLSINDATEIASYVAANFLRIIFAKNKELKKEEFNGVFGIISNIYNDLFSDQFTNEDYKNMVDISLKLLNDTNFDNNSKIFFSSIIKNS